MPDDSGEVTRLLAEIERLLGQQSALAAFGSYAFHEADIEKVLNEAARICAEALRTPYCKICRYRPETDDLIIEAGVGWRFSVNGVVYKADQTTPQGRAFMSGSAIVLEDVQNIKNLRLPDFYKIHDIVNTIDVCIRGFDGTPYGVLEVDSPEKISYTDHDIAFLTGYANVLAETTLAADRLRDLQGTIERMQTVLQEKDVMAQELQHRVRNNLQLINGMLIDQLRQSTNQRVQAGIRGIVRRVMSLSHVYDHLLGVGMARTVDFGEYLKVLCNNLPEMQISHEGISLNLEIESLVIDLDTVTALGLVAVELISNSYEHAFPERIGTIRVNLHTEDDTGVMTISDDGVGFGEVATQRRHGVGLVARLLQQVKGTASREEGAGTTWVLRFPRNRAIVEYDNS